MFLATDVTLPGAVDWVMMQSCFGSHFMLVLEKQEKFDGHVQFFAGKIRKNIFYAKISMKLST